MKKYLLAVVLILSLVVVGCGKKDYTNDVKNIVPSGSNVNYGDLLHHFMDNETWSCKDDKVSVEGPASVDTHISKYKITFNKDGSFASMTIDDKDSTKSLYDAFISLAINTYNADIAKGIPTNVSFEDRYVSYTKQGHFDSYNTKQIETTFANYFTDGKWKYSGDIGGDTTVTFTGNHQPVGSSGYDSNSIGNYTIIFTYNINTRKFNMTSVSINGKAATASSVIKYIFS